MEKVIAVVVSYNRQNLLSECIKALRNQTRRPDAILVVNNGSTDNTEQWLKTQKDIQFITQNNVGSGGGFNAGISHAFKAGYSWVWCMDDDGHPKENALEQLLQHDTHERSLLNCAVINKEDRKSFVWNTGNYASIDDVTEPLIKDIAHPFNGTLIHRAIIEKVGLPKASLFLWGDESEYLYRITKKYNFPVYTVTSSIHYHPAAAFKYSQDWDFKSQWKMYYYIRNRFEINKAKFSSKLYAIFHYLFFLAAMVGIVMVYQKTNKLKKLSFIVWPMTDALKNNYSATPSYILEKLNNNKHSKWQFPFRVAFHNTWHLFFSGNQTNPGNTTTA
ncbi:MAG: glycosyltransferase family 2 protein [Ferruginibacter sp.]